MVETRVKTKNNLFVLAFKTQVQFPIYQNRYFFSRGRDDDSDKVFEGKEIRLIELLKQVYNFTIEYREATEDTKIG